MAGMLAIMRDVTSRFEEMRALRRSLPTRPGAEHRCEAALNHSADQARRSMSVVKEHEKVAAPSDRTRLRIFDCDVHPVPKQGLTSLAAYLPKPGQDLETGSVLETPGKPGCTASKKRQRSVLSL